MGRTVATRTSGGRGWRLGRVGGRLGIKDALVLVMMKNKLEEIKALLETARSVRKSQGFTAADPHYSAYWKAWHALSIDEQVAHCEQMGGDLP